MRRSRLRVLYRYYLLFIIMVGLWCGLAQAAGKRWVSRGTEGGEIAAMVADPQNPSIVYAGGTGGNIFESTDGGAEWKRRGSLPVGVGLRLLAIDPQNTSTLYAGTYNGIYKTTNGGTNWAEIINGLSSFVISALSVDAQSPDTLYATSTGGDCSFFKSTAIR